MAITFTLAVPLKNQLGERTSDGQPNENDHYNCVATSLGVALEYLLKRPFDGDALKDAVYGQGYKGTMAAVAFIAYCARLGVDLVAINGSQDQLMAALERELRAGHPCLITMPSMWGSAPSQPGWDPVHPSGWTHVGVAAGYGPGWLRIMNDWGGFWHDGTTDYWRLRLCYGQIWRVALKGAMKMGVPAGWTDDGATLKAPNGHVVRMGFRTYIMGHDWDAVNVPLEDEQHRNQVEWHNPSLGGGQRQLFARTALRWNNNSEGVKEEDLGAELHAVETTLSAANAQIDTLKQQLADALAHQTAPLTAYQQACIAAAESDMAHTSALASATALRGK